jgi:tetratricopeptide (TPR) repeat protein
LYELGLTYYADGKNQKALKNLKLALHHDKTEAQHLPDIYYHIGLAYAREEKFEKAIFPLTQCGNLVPSELKYVHERAKAY